MTPRTAVVTGGLRGLGRAMAIGLAESGCRVIAVGHLAQDAEGPPMHPMVHAIMADLRDPAACDGVVAAAAARFGPVDILVNNAGLTFTTIWPDMYRRKERPKFWEGTDEMVTAVMMTNYVVADQMARRVAPGMVARGWGRIINVTTKLDTMNRAGTCPYGASKAALELASEVWAKECEGTGMTVNIVNPGGGANTPGIAEEMKAWSTAGTIERLVEPDDMVPPLLFVASAEADGVNGFRFDARTWDRTRPPMEAARANTRPAGLTVHPLGAWA